MSHTRKLIVPAAIVLGLFLVAPLVVGFEDASAGGHRGAGSNARMGSHENSGGQQSDHKNGGGEQSKNGGGEHSKNGGNPGGGEHSKNGGNPGGGEQGKNGNNGNEGNPGRGEHGRGHGRPNGGDGNGPGEPNMGNQPSFSFGPGSGSSMSYGMGNITCVVNGQVIPVRSVSECRYGRGYAQEGESYFGGYGSYRFGNGSGGDFNRGAVARYHRRVTEYQPQDGFGYNGYAADRYMGSPAAVMQAQKRMHDGYGNGSDGGYSAGYYYGGDYGVPGNGSFHSGGDYYGEGMPMRSRHHHRGHHLLRGYQMRGGYGYRGQGGCDCGSYDPGYIVHYGPTISKDGGY